MGLVISISAYLDWGMTYFVQSMNEEEAKEKAYKMFKQTVSCLLPDTLDEAENSENICIEVLATIGQIIL